MNDKDILKRLLELGLEKLMDQNPDFSFTSPTVQRGPDIQEPSGPLPEPKLDDNPQAKTDNPTEDAEWERRFGKT